MLEARPPLREQSDGHLHLTPHVRASPVRDRVDFAFSWASSPAVVISRRRGSCQLSKRLNQGTILGTHGRRVANVGFLAALSIVLSKSSNDLSTAASSCLSESVMEIPWDCRRDSRARLPGNSTFNAGGPSSSNSQPASTLWA